MTEDGRPQTTDDGLLLCKPSSDLLSPCLTDKAAVIPAQAGIQAIGIVQSK